jgi:hypothetical protein
MKPFTAYQQAVKRNGEKAKKEGKSLTDNPHKHGYDLQERCLWAAGWNDAKNP